MRECAVVRNQMGVRDIKVEADAIQPQNGLNPSVCVREEGALLGQIHYDSECYTGR